VDVLEELDASGGDRTREKWNEAIRRVEDGRVELARAEGVGVEDGQRRGRGGPSR
jgi:hypothetical protein